MANTPPPRLKPSQKNLPTLRRQRQFVLVELDEMAAGVRLFQEFFPRGHLYHPAKSMLSRTPLFLGARSYLTVIEL